MDTQEMYLTRVQEQAELLEELNARVFTHKTAIVGGVIMSDYIKEQKSMGGAMLPETIIEKQAQEYSQKALQHALATGNLNSMYEDTWEKIKNALPDETNVVVINTCDEEI